MAIVFNNRPFSGSGRSYDSSEHNPFRDADPWLVGLSVDGANTQQSDSHLVNAAGFRVRGWHVVIYCDEANTASDAANQTLSVTDLMDGGKGGAGSGSFHLAALALGATATGARRW